MEREIEVGGVPTHVHETGDGPTVLLLHGSGPGVSAWANWRLVLPALARSFHVVAHDQLGFGRTGRPADGRYGRAPGRATRSRWSTPSASSVSRRRRLDGRRDPLSMAAERRELSSGVPTGTTVSSSTCRPGSTRSGSRAGLEQMRRLVKLFAYDDDAVATDDLVTLRYETSLEPRTRESYEAMFPAPRQRWVDDLALDVATLRSIAQPTLLIHGYEDEVIPFAASSLKALDLLPTPSCTRSATAGTGPDRAEATLHAGPRGLLEA